MRVLIIDDEKEFTEELAEYLIHQGMWVEEAQTPVAGLQILAEKPIDLLILDIRLPGTNGLELLKELRVIYPLLEVIMVSGHGDMESVITAMRLGAIDYLRKPFRHVDIQIAIERSKKYIHLQNRLRVAEQNNSLITRSLEEKINRQFIGVSDSIQSVHQQALVAAEYPDTNVLITGESGTGKENIARIIHYSSSRRENIFCAVNSSAITDSLLESEFFGHKRGSFTGAISDKKGFFEISDQGTLFLDEIADMPLNLQSKILRSIEEKVITRVGDTTPIHTNFRIISATNFDLDEMVQQKRFRLDLIHRLNTITIHIPPLRERPEDIGVLADSFIRGFAQKLNKPVPVLTDSALNRLQHYTFPGNVRELRNIIERAIIFCKSGQIGSDDLLLGTTQVQLIPVAETKSLSEFQLREQQQLLDVLKAHDFNQTDSARQLGISRDALIRKMKKYGIGRGR